MFNMVEFCISNLANGSQATYDALEKDPDFDVLEYGCTSHCTTCASGYFAVVNGEVVKADTPEQLTKAIYQYIEENPMW